MDPDIVDMDHVSVRVTDLDAALEFYHDLLGLPIRDRERYEAGDVPYVAVAAGGRHLHLVPVDEPSIDPNTAEADDRSTADSNHGSRVPLGGEHVCLLVRSNRTDSREQLDDLLAAIEDAGYDVEPDEPTERYGAYGRDWAAYVRDPDGRRVELKVH